MHAVVIRETGDREQIDASGPPVTATVVPRVREAPGFVSAIWMSDGAGGTLNVLAFDSEEAARAAMEAARTAPRAPFMQLETVSLYAVGATA